MKLTVILFTKEEAEFFITDQPDADCALALTPDARRVLLDHGFPVFSTMDVFSDYSHLRIMAMTRSFENDLFERLHENSQLTESAKETFRGYVHIFANCALRTWVTLKKLDPPFLVPVGAQWKKEETREKVNEILLQKITRDFSRHHLKGQTRVHDRGNRISIAVVRLINHWIAKKLAKKDVVLVNSFSYGMKSLAKKLIRNSNSTYCFQVLEERGGIKSILRSLLNVFILIKGGRMGSLTVITSPSRVTEKTVHQLIDELSPSKIKDGIKFFYDSLLNSVVLTDGLVSEAEKLVSIVKPKKIITNYLRWYTAAALAEAGKKHNITSMLISHGSHTAQESFPAMWESVEQSRGVLFSSLADQIVLQSPHAEKFVSQHKIPGELIRSKPIMWGYQDIKPRGPQKIRRILHTGTFKSWSSNRPWIFETSDEFIHGLTTLVESLSGIENMELVIRIRPYPECSVETIMSFLPEADFLKVKTDGSFLDDLAEADLLVSWASTTIEEALNARKPVLLWGGSQRFHHISPRTTFPTKEDRGAVYAPKVKSDLRELTEHILDAHAEIPLSEEELEGHVWSSDTPGIPEFVEQLSCL